MWQRGESLTILVIDELIGYDYQEQLVHELMEGDSIMNPYYGHQATFGDDWKVEKRLEREEKVKGAQSYKRKNQYHPAFRK